MIPDDVLERLIRANPVPGDLPAPPIEPLLDRLEQPPTSGTGAPRGAARRRGSLGAIAAVVLSAVALVVGAGALVFLHGHKPAPKAAPAAAVPGRQQLIDILGVLRRPQTYADLHSPWIARFLQRPPLAMLGTPDLPLIRRLGVTPWGSGVVLIPMKPATAASLAALHRRFPQLPERFLEGRAQRSEEGVVLDVDSGGGCCATAAAIESSGDLALDGAGVSFAGGSTQTRLTGSSGHLLILHILHTWRTAYRLVTAIASVTWRNDQTRRIWLLIHRAGVSDRRGDHRGCGRRRGSRAGTGGPGSAKDGEPA